MLSVSFERSQQLQARIVKALEAEFPNNAIQYVLVDYRRPHWMDSPSLHISAELVMEKE